MGFLRATGLGYANIVNFSGRASRAEFWWFQIFQVLLGIGMWLGAVLWIMAQPDPSIWMTALENPTSLPALPPQLELTASAMGLGSFVLCFLPSLSVTVRRLHDTGRRGWYMFMPALISFLAFFAAGFSAAFLPNAYVGLAVVLAGLVTLGACLRYLAILCTPGAIGPNRFGNDPTETTVGTVARKKPAFDPTNPNVTREDRERAYRAEISAYYRNTVLTGIKRAEA